MNVDEKNQIDPANLSIDSLHALVVDDEQALRSAVSQYLEGLGFTCEQVAGVDDLVHVLSSDVHLVVSDLSLGKGDGIDIMEHLAAAAFSGKVLLMSAHDVASLVASQHLGTQLGLDMIGWLRKPFRPEQLKQIIDAHMTHRSS